MKKLELFMVCICSFVFQIAFAQSEGAIGFGGPSFHAVFSPGAFTVESGGLGGGFITKNFYLGGGGFGVRATDEIQSYDMAYGGVMIGSNFKVNQKLGLNIYMISGYGGVTQQTNEIRKRDDIWVLRPMAELDIGITNWVHLGIGGGYRFTQGSEIPQLGDQKLSAPYAGITLRFGNWTK